MRKEENEKRGKAKAKAKTLHLLSTSICITHIAHCYSTSQLEREWEEGRDKSSDTRDRNGHSTSNNFQISSSPFSYRNPEPLSSPPFILLLSSPLSPSSPYSLNGRSPLSLPSPFHVFFQISPYPYLFQSLIRILFFTLGISEFTQTSSVNSPANDNWTQSHIPFVFPPFSSFILLILRFRFHSQFT